MSHPREPQLSLYAGGDLGFFDRFRIGHHLRSCEVCRRSVESFHKARTHLRRASADLPESLNWERLAAEMTGNIRVGLAAGECVPPASRPAQKLLWKPALAIAGLTAVVMSGWWLNFPREQRESLVSSINRVWSPRAPRMIHDPSVYLEANRTGIRLSDNGSAMTMMHPGAAPAVISVSTQGSMNARYVDDDTGQVTITNVYAQ